MFKLGNYKETALTPMLGGIFEDLQLKIEYFNQEKTNNLIYNSLSKNSMKDPGENAKLFAQSVKDSVVGWQGADVEYSDEHKDTLFANYINDDTGIEKPDQDPSEEVKYYKLGEYITFFRGEKKHFLVV